MKAISKKNLRKARGQGMTEYIIIVALIAIAAIGVITLFGDNIRKLFGASAAALAGEDNVENDGQLSTDALKKKTMKNFGQNNTYN
jgi:pilus assembly protein Flp/PilA